MPYRRMRFWHPLVLHRLHCYSVSSRLVDQAKLTYFTICRVYKTRTFFAISETSHDIVIISIYHCYYLSQTRLRSLSILLKCPSYIFIFILWKISLSATAHSQTKKLDQTMKFNMFISKIFYLKLKSISHYKVIFFLKLENESYIPRILHNTGPYWKGVPGRCHTLVLRSCSNSMSSFAWVFASSFALCHSDANANAKNGSWSILCTTNSVTINTMFTEIQTLRVNKALHGQ